MGGRQEQRLGSRKALDRSVGRCMACLIRMVDRGSALCLWGPEEYFSKGSVGSLKIGCRDTWKSVFREIPRTNSSAASQGGRWRDLWWQSSHSREWRRALSWGSCLSHSQFQPPVLGPKLVLPQSEWEQKPQGQIWVVAEREAKPSCTRCSALCSLYALPPVLSLDRRWQQREAWGWGPEPSLIHPPECGVLRGDSDLVPRSHSAQTMEETGLTRREQLRTTSNHRMRYSHSSAPGKQRKKTGSV